MSKQSDHISKLVLNIDTLLAGAEERQELDLLVDVESVIGQIFEERAKGLPHPAFGTKIAFRPGELTLWGGMAGSGKSQLVGQVIAWLLAQGERATIASLEMPLRDTLRRMLTQCLDAPPTVGAANSWAEAMSGRLYLYDQIDRVPAARLLAMCKAAATKLGSTHIVIDSLTKAGLPVDGDGYLSAQTDFVDSLQRIAKHLDIHIHLVVHLRKGENGTRRGMHDIRGASQISDLADNVLILVRDVEKERILEEGSFKPEAMWDETFAKLHAKAKLRPDAVLQIEKQRATGSLGDVKLDFHHRSGQFIPHGQVQAMPWKLYN
jgi:twinkle protein